MMRIFSDKAGGTGTLGTRGRRGMALLMVITTIAVLTSVVVEFAYSTHVDVRLAANARDALRAHYLAKSATNFARVLLFVQTLLDRSMQGGMNFRVWEAIPIQGDAIRGFVEATRAESTEAPPSLPPAQPRPGLGELVPAEGLQPFGSYQGTFFAEIEDEEAKINLNKLNNPGLSGAFTAQLLYQLIADPRWDFLFEEENTHRERISREEFLVRIKDFIDENEVESALDLTLATGVFADSASDEERHYVRYPQRYRPKNALFDSMDELHLVAGMSERLMAAFEDRLTVYPDINAKLNLNTRDPLQRLTILRLMAREPHHPAFENPYTVESMLRQLDIMQASMPFAPLTAQQFASVLQMHGLEARQDVMNTEFSNTSQTFTIRAIGQAGDVTQTITTVVRLDGGLGKVLYYRED